MEYHTDISWTDCEDVIQEHCIQDTTAVTDPSTGTKMNSYTSERRSKSLFQLQLAAIKFTHSSSSSSTLLQFQNSILTHISDFAFDASCVFLDIKILNYGPLLQ